MKLRKGLSLLLGGAIISLLASASYAASWEQKSFADKGGLKTVHIYNPATTSPIGKGKALLIVLRGCAQAASAFKTANLDKVAEEYGMVIAAADPNNPNLGFNCWQYWTTYANSEAENILTTTQEIISDAQYNIDPDQVYIAGLSSGGAQAMTTGCKYPNVFAGMGLDAAPSAGTSMNGALGDIPEGDTEKAAATCKRLAGNNSSNFATQITSTAYGTNDGGFTGVPKGYGLINAGAMAIIYGASKTDKTNTVQGFDDVIESTWTDGRVSMVEFGGVPHAWPGGEGAGEGEGDDEGATEAYINGTSANYGMYLGKFFSENNLRVQDDPKETCKSVTLDSFAYNPETKIFTANGTATEDCGEAVVFINVAESADFVTPVDDTYSFEIQNVSCPDEIKVTLENASLEQYTATDIYTGSCGNTDIPPVIKSFNAITTTGAVSLSGLATDEDGTVVNAIITIEKQEYNVDIAENGVFTLMVEGLAAREYAAELVVMDNDGLTAAKSIKFTIEESQKVAPVLTLDPIEIYKNYAVLCGTATDADGEITVAAYTIDGNSKEINNMNPDGSFCVHMPDLENGDHEVTIVIMDNDRLGAEKTVKFFTSDESLPPTVFLNQVEVDGQTAVITGTATDSDGEVASVTIEINDKAYPVILNGTTFTITLTDLEAGEYKVVATAYDNDQLSATDSTTFVIQEKVAPTVTVTATVDGTSATISGTASDEDGEVVEIVIAVNGTEYTVSGGDYSKTLTGLEPGSYDVVVTAIDDDDLEATATTSFEIKEVEKVAPKVTVKATINGTSATISGSATDEDGEVVEVVIAVNGTEYTVSGGSYSKTLTGLTAGDYSVTVTAIDDDGLTTTANTSFTIEEEVDYWTAWLNWWKSFWSF